MTREHFDDVVPMVREPAQGIQIPLDEPIRIARRALEDAEGTHKEAQPNAAQEKEPWQNSTARAQKKRRGRAPRQPQSDKQVLRAQRRHEP